MKTIIIMLVIGVAAMTTGLLGYNTIMWFLLGVQLGILIKMIIKD